MEKVDGTNACVNFTTTDSKGFHKGNADGMLMRKKETFATDETRIKHGLGNYADGILMQC